ncbi:LINE-type retrotransposon LIb DNA [Senna tora]|uniref:LINE-type retrotransposon LIb DNA n=1 Tax=Senna tora TaxID=362788 RepID=A0A834U160_9FABA|nr:LINE-type retrotransposon LIb DNA [Senna tora]
MVSCPCDLYAYTKWFCVHLEWLVALTSFVLIRNGWLPLRALCSYRMEGCLHVPYAQVELLVADLLYKICAKFSYALMCSVPIWNVWLFIVTNCALLDWNDYDLMCIASDSGSNNAISSFGTLVSLCRVILSDFSEAKVIHTYREENACADILAKLAVSSQPILMYFDHPPSLHL